MIPPVSRFPFQCQARPDAGSCPALGSLWLLLSGSFHAAEHVLSRGTRWPAPQQACGQGRLCSPPRRLGSVGTPVSRAGHWQRLMGASLCCRVSCLWGGGLDLPSSLCLVTRGVGSSHRACAVKTSQCLLPKGSVHPRPRARPTEENKAKQTGALALTAKLRQGQAGLLLPRAQHSSQKVFVALFC